jgi:hypothetical protein
MPDYRIARKSAHMCTSKRPASVARTAARVAAIVAACCLPSPAWSDSLSIQVDPPDADKRAAANTHWDVYLEGEIDAGAAERVQQELTQIGDDGADVHFDSPGGNLADGMKIGRLLRTLGATTTVGRRAGRGSDARPGKCFSACSLAFLGGVYRYVPSGSLFGVHRVAMAHHSDQDFDAGQIVAAQVSGYIRDMGVDSRLFDRMASVGKDQIYVLGGAELRALRVVNEGRQAAEWWSDMSAGGPSLTGSQQTAAGTHKAVLGCEGGAVVFRSVYSAGSEAEPIATGQWIHSLVIDGVALPLAAPTSIEDVDGNLSATFGLSADQARKLAGASSIGHAMRGDRSAPQSLGYSIDIDAAAAKRLRQFVDTCLGSR